MPNLRSGQMIGELRLRRKIQRFQHHAVGVGAVAGEAAHDIAALEVTVGQRRARGDRHAAADDRVRAQMADGEIRDVHRTAAAPAITVVLAEEFANRAIDVLLQRGFDQILMLVGSAIAARACAAARRVIWRMATVPFARLSPWPRCVLVMLSATAARNTRPPPCLPAPPRRASARGNCNRGSARRRRSGA
jgi:hypothetical protein